MKKGELLFVYGTLRKGERADLAKGSKQFNVDWLGIDEINGLLYHLGAYPGLKLLGPEEQDFSNSFPSVIGEVFIIKDASVGALLDAYEGYHADNPKSGLYDRTQVFTRQGRLVWVYLYNPPVTEDQKIETGDWKNPRLCVTRTIPGLRSEFAGFLRR